MLFSYRPSPISGICQYEDTDKRSQGELKVLFIGTFVPETPKENYI